MRNPRAIDELGGFTESRPVNLSLAYQRTLEVYRDVLGPGGINIFRREVIPAYDQLYGKRNTSGIIRALQTIMRDVLGSGIASRERPSFLREVIAQERRFDARRMIIQTGIIRSFASAQFRSVTDFGPEEGIIATALYGSWGRNAATRYSDVDFINLTLGDEVGNTRDSFFAKTIYEKLLENARMHNLYMLLHEPSVRPIDFDMDEPYGIFRLNEALVRTSRHPIYDFTLITIHPSLISFLPDLLKDTDPNVQITPIIDMEGLHAASVFLPALVFQSDPP